MACLCRAAQDDNATGTKTCAGTSFRTALTIDEAHARDVFGRTSALAEQYGLSVYDAAYLEVAIRRQLPLGTRDRALRSAAERSGIPRFDQ